MDSGLVQAPHACCHVVCGCEVSYALVVALVLHAARQSTNTWFDQLPWFIRVAEKPQPRLCHHTVAMNTAKSAKLGCAAP